jgi:hypothetical protein
MQQDCSVTNQYELMRMVVKGEIHDILNNLPRSLILIHFHFGRAGPKLLAIRLVVAEITDLSKDVELLGAPRRKGLGSFRAPIAVSAAETAGMGNNAGIVKHPCPLSPITSTLRTPPFRLSRGGACYS